MSSEASGLQVVTRTEWHETATGCQSLTLECAGHTVRVMQRKPGGPFYRVILVQGKQDWESLRTKDPQVARNRASALLRFLAQLSAPVATRDPTASEATPALRPAMAADNAAPLTLGKLWDLYKELPRFRKQKKHTRDDLCCRARIILAAMGAHTPVVELDTDAFQEYELRRIVGGIEYEVAVRSPKHVDEVTKEKRLLAPRKRTSAAVGLRTVEADMKLLRSMILWALEKRIGGKRLLTEDVMVGYTIPDEKNPRQPVATHARFLATLQALEELASATTDPSKRRLCQMMRVALIVLEGTGRRITAVLGLRWSDLHLDLAGGFENAEITFRADLDKKGRSARVPAMPEVACALHQWRAIDLPEFENDLVFPNQTGTAPVTRDRMAQILTEAEEKAGLEPLDGSLFHAYRRKFATERGRMGEGAVMQLMGLTDVKVFKESYCKTTREDLKLAARNPRRMQDLELEKPSASTKVA